MGHRTIFGLMAGTFSIGLHAQEVPRPSAPAPVTSQAEALPTIAKPDDADPSSTLEFRGADGKPLPADLQRQLDQELRKRPPVPKTKSSVAAGDQDIVVSGQRPRGAVMGDIPPERTFSALDIKAFGAANIDELLQTLAPQVSSNRGRESTGPVVLLNGRRVSSFSEIARIPAEAIQRMEVFPEEVALKYGYRADQKVVNVVTFQKYRTRNGQINYTRPTEGGRNAAGVAADYFAIQGDARVTVAADYSRSTSLSESSRNVTQLQVDTGDGRFRTLLPKTERLVLDALISGHLTTGVISTLSGRFDVNRSGSLLGPGRDQPLERNSETRNLHIGTTQNFQKGEWTGTFTGGYDRARSRIGTEREDGLSRPDDAKSINVVAGTDFLLTGPIVELPAGPLSTSIHAGVQVRDFRSASRRDGIEQQAERSRDQGTIQANIDLPIFDRTVGIAALGSLSLNANFEVERLSDIGTLSTSGYGLSWSPTEHMSVIASVTDEQGAPTLEQLSGPVVLTPNVRTYDFIRREVIDVARAFGGNTDLRNDDRHVVRVGMNVRPLPKSDFTVSIDYVATRIDNPIAPFPIATPEIEQAFPDRFLRDAESRLLRIDSRPLNFLRSEEKQLRWGFNLLRPLGRMPAAAQSVTIRSGGSMAELQRSLPPGAIILKAEPGSAGARSLDTIGSRFTLSLYHTWNLKNNLLVREDLPRLDLLDGSAVDFRGGPRRHEIEFQAGVFKRGLGVRVTGRWQSSATVSGIEGASSDLRFADFGTINVSLFANLADRLPKEHMSDWWKGTRATIGIVNVLNSRPQVTDRFGSTPLSYQPAYLDPLGRTVSLNFRKRF